MKNAQISSIAIGSFDGVHLAHQKLIEQSDGVVIIERGCGTLTHGYRRSLYINKPIFIYHFETLSSLTPKAFIAMICQDFPQLQKIVVGYDFAFGYQKKGNIQTLQEIFEGEVVVVEEVMFNTVSIHSRTIKKYIQNGNIAMANTLFGRAYEMIGKVIQGQGIGSKALVSTINISVEEYLLPQDGVYASRILVDGVWYNSISFIGHRTSTDDAFAIETHILQKSIELKNHDIKLQWIGFIRENQKFEDLKELKAQILIDIQQAQKIHNER